LKFASSTSQGLEQSEDEEGLRLRGRKGKSS
jgi:hypothetical protein